MAYRRKRKFYRPKLTVPQPLVDDFSDEQKELYTIEVVKSFNLDRHSDISWKITRPDSDTSTSEVPIKFVNSSQSSFAIRTAETETEEPPNILIGQLLLQGETTGLPEFLNSVHVIKTTLRRAPSDEYYLCLFISLPAVTDDEILLSSPVSVSPNPSAVAIAELASMCRRGGIIQLVASPKQGSCSQLVISILINSKVLNVGGADSLPGNRCSIVKEAVVKGFHKSLVPLNMLNPHSEVILDDNAFEAPGTIAYVHCTMLIMLSLLHVC